MAKVGIFKITEQDLSFKYEVNVTTEGIFTTTLPADIVEALKAANVGLGMNRAKRLGYFADKSLDGLRSQVRAVLQEYHSRELIDERIVIRYQIRTTCSYCLDLEGNPVPNGSKRWTGTEDYRWQNGTVSTNSSDRHPFGLLLWSEVVIRRQYKYRSGVVKTEHEHCHMNDFEDHTDKPQLDYLTSIVSISPVQYEKVQEIDYSESVAAVFVGMYKAIFRMNERIKEWTTPEAIMKLAESKTKLLG